jgi:hypothetical protein
MTAIEWLMEMNIKQNGIITAADYHTAKEMEKKQMNEAFKKGQESTYRLS